MSRAKELINLIESEDEDGASSRILKGIGSTALAAMGMTANKDLESLTEDAKEISAEILRQLGGSKFIAMTGAKNLAHDDDGSLSFKIGRNKSGAQYVKVQYNHGSDDYTLSFGKISGEEYKELKSYKGVYADMLQELFTEFTGMDTHL